MSGLQYAGEYSLDALRILTSSGVIFDIKKLVQYIEIYEDLDNPFLSGTITFLDIDNIIENAPIIGQEFLALKITTPDLEEISIDFTENVFSIFKILAKDDVNLNTQAFTLSFCSSELVRSNRTKISKSYTNSIDKIVELVMRDSRYVNTKKKLFFEPTSGIRKIVSPNLPPFHFLNQLKEEALSEKYSSPHYFFYETCGGENKGIHFRSLQSMFASGIVGVYNTGDLEPTGGKQKEVINAYQRVLQYQVNANNDMLLNTKGGMLGSKITTHNLLNKNVQSKTFNYFNDFDKFGRIDENPIYNNTSIDKDNNTIGSFSDAKTFVHPVYADNNGFDQQHTDSNENYLYKNSGIFDALQHRQSKKMELELGVNISLKVLGNTTISVGQMIDLTIPITGRVHEKENNEYLSGRYLITKTKHMFIQATREHEVLIHACKDSLPKEYPIHQDSSEPVASSDSSVNVTYT